MLPNRQRNLRFSAFSGIWVFHLLRSLAAPSCLELLAIVLRHRFVAEKKTYHSCGLSFFLPTLIPPSRMKKHFVAKQRWGTSPGRRIPKARPVLVRTIPYYLLPNFSLALNPKQARALKPQLSRCGFTLVKLFVSAPPWKG